MEFFVTAAKGTEPLLRDELREMRLPQVKCDRGGVHFDGDWLDAFRACLHTRIGLRVLHVLGRFPATSADDLYDAVREVDWKPWLTPRHTLAVTAFCRDSELRHTQFIAQKTKDAIVDQLRDELRERPNVDRQDPDVHIFLHLVKNQATVYLDLAGESLHRRGYRKDALEAPLKENLAAALLRYAGWGRIEAPLCDPMCGSGTIAIEAALWAHGIPPGLSRECFGFERWPSHDESLKKAMKHLRAEARAGARRKAPPVMASDIDPRALEATAQNARISGVKLEISRRSVLEQKPLDPPGFIVTNPPYGMRLETDHEFLTRLGEVFRELHDHTVAVIVPQDGPRRAIPLHSEKYQIVFNGDIECRMYVYEIR